MFKYDEDAIRFNEEFIKRYPTKELREEAILQVPWSFPNKMYSIFWISSYWRQFSTYSQKAIEEHYIVNSDFLLERKDTSVEIISSVPQWGNDGNKDFPHDCGAYLLGNTVFNPITQEEYYWIKVGQSEDIAKRIRGYQIENPMVWCIDSIPVDKADKRNFELNCHAKLAGIASHRAKNSNEWFSVSREDYMDICDLGFKWFEMERVHDDD